jgi:hypothetical protein
MDEAEARELLQRTEREMSAACEAMRRAQVIVESSELIIRGVLRAHPELSQEFELNIYETATEPETPLRGSAAVLSVLQVEEGRWFTIHELVEEMGQQGLLPNSANPANAVRTAVERLVKSPDTNVWKGPVHGGVMAYRYHEPGSEPEPKASSYAYDEEPF